MTTPVTGSVKVGGVSYAAAASLTLPPPVTPPDANVHVDFTKMTVPVRPLAVGITISTYSGNGQANINRSAQWLAAIKNLAPGHCRIPLRWNKGNPGSSAGGAQSSGDAAQYVKNIVSTGALPYVIYGGDTSDNGGLNGADAAAFVKYFNSGGEQNGGPVKYWIVGNEPDNGGGGTAYLSLLPGILSAMHGADPSVKISAPAAAYWDTGLLSAAAKIASVDILSYHAYNGGDPPPNGYPNQAAYHDNILTMQGWKSGIEYGVEEVNWHFQNDGSGAFYDFRNTCFIADAAGQVLSAGGHFTQYSDSNGPLGLMNDGTGQGQPGSFGTPLPAYWGIGIWTGMNGAFKRWGANIVSTSTTFASNILTVFACDNGKIVVVNKDTAAHDLVIAMTGKVSGTFNVWMTQHANPTATIIRTVQASPYSGGTLTVTVPAGTAASIDVT